MRRVYARIQHGDGDCRAPRQVPSGGRLNLGEVPFGGKVRIVWRRGGSGNVVTLNHREQSGARKRFFYALNGGLGDIDDFGSNLRNRVVKRGTMQAESLANHAGISIPMHLDDQPALHMIW